MRHCQSTQQSFAALQSLLFRCSVDHLSWNTTKRQEWQIELRDAPNTCHWFSGVWQYCVCSNWFPVRLFVSKSNQQLVRCCPSSLLIAVFHCLVFAQWLNLADQHVGMFFTDYKFNCLSGNFETILLYPKPSLHRVWILILSLANILPIINWAKIQTLNFIHKINKIYLQNKMT